MNYRRNGLKALGLSLLVALGLMAFAASGVQASGKVLVEGLTAPFTVGVTGAEDEPVGDKLRILGLELEIYCKDAEASGTLTNAGHGHVQVLFKECFANGVNPDGTLKNEAPCVIKDHITATALALVILHSGTALTTAQHGTGTGSPYVLFTPLDGLTFAFVLNHGECPLPEKAPVKGCVVAKVVTTGDQVTHLISTTGMLSLFGCELKYGANASHLDVDAFVSLTNSVHGNHEGRKWGVE